MDKVLNNAVTYHYAGHCPFPSREPHVIKCSPRRFSPSCHAWSHDIEWLRYSRELDSPRNQASPRKHQTHYNISHRSTKSEKCVGTLLTGFHMLVKILNRATTGYFQTPVKWISPPVTIQPMISIRCRLTRKTETNNTEKVIFTLNMTRRKFNASRSKEPPLVKLHLRRSKKKCSFLDKRRQIYV